MLMTQKNIDEDININEISYVEFSIKDLEKYRYEFEKLKEEKIIAKECEFESNSWVIRTGIRTISVSFNMTEIEYQKILKGGVIHLGYEEFGIALRSYTLIELRRLTNVSIMLTINNIKAFLKTSDGFSSSFMKEVVTNEVFNKRAYEIEHLLDFFNFIGVELHTEYIDNLQIVQKKFKLERMGRSSNRRKLSLFKEAFRLDDYMQQAISQLSDEEFEKFFPTVLWWKLSTIIPIRTGEIMATIKDCIRCEKGENKLILSRSNLKGRRRNSFRHTFEECYYFQEVKVSSELIGIIQRYNDIVDGLDGDRKFLISKKSIIKFWPQMSYAKCLENNREIFAYNNFLINVDEFYKQILNRKYGLNIVNEKADYELNDGEIQKFNIMDTRHFAIINMVLMGFEPFTIKELAGHENINSSYHYFSHVEEFVQCYVISLAKRKALKNTVTEQNVVLNTTYSELSRDYISKHIQKLNLLTKEYKVVDQGFCVYKKNDFSPCYAVDGNHKRCPHFIPDKKNAVNMIEELDKMDEELSIETEALRLLVEDHKKVVDFSNQYILKINSIRNKANNKAELLANYIVSSFSEIQ